MKLKDILIERVSSIVYHITSFPAAVKILKSDEMHSRTGYISFTRSLHGRYHKNNKIIGVIFEFDGDKLNQKYKGKPIGTEFHSDPFSDDPFDWDDEDDMPSSKENGQLEDRLFLPDSVLPNVTKYIKSATIYIPSDYLDRGENEFDEPYMDEIKSLATVMKLLDQRHIPYVSADSENDLSRVAMILRKYHK